MRTGCRVVGEMRMGRVKDQLVRSGGEPRGRVDGLTACCTSRWATSWHTESESVNGRVRSFRTSPAWSRRESLGEGEDARRVCRGVHSSPCDESGVLYCPVPDEQTQENGGDLLNLDRESISQLVKDVDATLSVRADRALPVVALLNAVRAHPVRGDVAVKDLRLCDLSASALGTSTMAPTCDWQGYETRVSERVRATALSHGRRRTAAERRRCACSIV